MNPLLGAMRRVPIWLAFALIAWVVMSVYRVGSPVDAVALDGTWEASWEDAAGVHTRKVDVPLLFGHNDIPMDRPVRLTRDVRVSSSKPQALWVDMVMYAASVEWDGVRIHEHGDPERPEASRHLPISLLATLPAVQAGTTHELTVTIRGNFGRGGLTGRVLVGDAPAVLQCALEYDTERLALALGLAMLGFLPLTVAATRKKGWAYIYFGLFATCFSVLSFGQSNFATQVIPETESLIRLRRLVEGPTGGLIICFMATLMQGRPSRLHLGILGFGLFTSTLGVLGPSEWLYSIELAQDGTLVLGLPLYFGVIVQGVRKKVPGAWLLVLMTVVPATYGLFTEMFHSHGVSSGNSQLFGSMLLLVSGCGATLMLRDAMSHTQYEGLVTRSMDAMLTLDTQHRIVHANPAAETILGPDLLDRSLLDFAIPVDRPVLRAHLDLGRTESDRVEFRLNRPTQAEVESLVTPLAAQRSMLVLRDITERRDLDRSLLRAARVETVGVLLGGIAHDFNNMLGTLLAHVGFLQSAKEDPGTQRRLERMESTIERASNLTHRLLTVARGSQADLGPTDIVQVCHSAADLVGPTLHPGVTLNVHLPSALPKAHADVEELEQVVVNLLVNARDALDQSGTIDLHAGAFEMASGTRGLFITVQDDGMGIPPDLESAIFQPFVTSKPGGTGLGLAVARQVVEDHMGRLWCERRTTGGTRFNIALRHADTVESMQAGTLPEGRKVLIVEDEAVLLDHYTRALREEGYDVTAMASPAASADWLLENEPDILVTDVVMDDMSGLQLANLCRHQYPSCPVLLVTGFIPDENLVNSDWHRLQKPVRASRLAATVGRIRRRAERLARGESETTNVTYRFPSLESLSGADLGLEDERGLAD